MRRHFRWDKKYLHWGVTAFCVIACAILFYMALSYLGFLGKAFKSLARILSPFIWGLVIAYLLNPLVKRQVKYEEYAEFFRAISKAAEQTKNQALHDEAEKFLFNVQNTVLPTLFDRPDGMEGGD